MVTILQIAAGIVIAVLILAFLPQIFSLLLILLAVAVAVAVLGGGILLLLAMGEAGQLILMVAGVLLAGWGAIWLIERYTGKREAAKRQGLGYADESPDAWG